MESLMSRKTVFEMFRRVFWSSMEGIDGIDELVKFLFARWSGVDTIIEEPFVKVRFWSVVLREKFVFEVAYKKVAVVTSHLGSHSTKINKDASKPPEPSFFHNLTICGLFLHQVNAEAVGTSNTNLNSAPSMNTSRSTNLFIILCSYHHFSTNRMALPPFIQTYHPQSLYSLRRSSKG